MQNDEDSRRCSHHDIIISREAIKFVAGPEKTKESEHRIVRFINERLEEAGVRQGDIMSVELNEDSLRFHGPFTPDDIVNVFKSELDKYREGWDRIFGEGFIDGLMDSAEEDDDGWDGEMYYGKKDKAP